MCCGRAKNEKKRKLVFLFLMEYIRKLGPTEITARWTRQGQVDPTGR